MNKKEEVLQEALLELRTLFDRLTSIYESLKIKVLAFIAGELALIPFIFSSGFDNMNSTEIIFFSLGLGFLAVSFGLLIWSAATASWDVPMNIEESQKLGKRYKTRYDLLIYLREDYEACIVTCLKRIKTRARVFNLTLLLLVAGALTLFVIKYT